MIHGLTHVDSPTRYISSKGAVLFMIQKAHTVIKRNQKSATVSVKFFHSYANALHDVFNARHSAHGKE